MDPVKMKTVYAVTMRDGEEHWTRIGSAFVKSDGALTIKLEAVPMSGEIHIRNYEQATVLEAALPAQEASRDPDPLREPTRTRLYSTMRRALNEHFGGDSCGWVSFDLLQQAQARADLAEQREMEARRTAEEFRQESQDNLQVLERVRQERETFRRNRNEFSTELMQTKAALTEANEAWRLIPPHEMILVCPSCGRQHLDVGEFATRVHRKHKCENTPAGPNTGCGQLWVPFQYATKGVERTAAQEIELLQKRALEAIKRCTAT